MKKKKKPGVFFSNPSDEDISRESKNTIETFVESGHTPVDTDHLSGDYKRLINLEYGRDRKKEKEI
ncbi:MAG: hypothetical protein JXB33_02840 [Clostridia bacterium]|nr:hypothetical protein [Clostridia bacterium]